MTLDQLIEVRDRAGLNTAEQREIISLLNQHRFDFGVKELSEIMPPEFCGWISRRIKPLSQEQDILFNGFVKQLAGIELKHRCMERWKTDPRTKTGVV